MKPINELTNKAMIAVGGVLLTGSLSLMGLGLRAYGNSIYVQRVQLIDAQIDLADRRIYEIDQIFATVDDLDRITSKRLGADKGYYESWRESLLRQRGDL